MKNRKLTKISFIGLVALSLSLFNYSNAKKDHIVANAATIITEKASQSYIDNYYSSISDSLEGNALKGALETLLKNERGQTFSYSSMQTTAFPYTDPDPNRPNDGYIVSFYSGTPVSGYSGMNKEHTWPDSHGGGKIEDDPHVIRPTLTSENSARGNQYYAQAPNPGWDPAAESWGQEKYRGIAARIILYGAVIGHSQGLVLEDVGRGQASGTKDRMGKLGDLLKWNFTYPVDQSEIIRNETLDRSLSYNRNPFIDDPSLACKIWGDYNTNTQSICAEFSTPPTSISLSSTSLTLNVSEIRKLDATLLPANADQRVTWSSSNNNIITVNDGVLTPLQAGDATITATSVADPSLQAQASITVTNLHIPVTGISIPNKNITVAIGSTINAGIGVLPAHASNKDITYISSNSAVATVTSTGAIRGINSGNATITATTVDGGFAGTISVSVIRALPGSLENPFTVAQAIKQATKQGSTQGSERYYIKGIISSVTEESAQYGNATFAIKDYLSASESFTVYRVPYGNFANDIEVGKEIVVYGAPFNYGGHKPEISGGNGNEIISITQPVSANLLSIEVTSPPSKTAYKAGESFDKTGMVVMGHYDNGTSIDVSNAVSVSPSVLTLGLTSVTLSYEGKTTSTPITVSESVTPVLETYTAYFYNSSIDNSATGTITASELNHGKTGVNGFEGFGGVNIATTLSLSTAYYPRSGGLGMGSAKNPGSLTIGFSEDYQPIKVELKVNDSSGGTISVNASSSIKSSTPGSLGTNLSNPSDGTPYIYEFSAPISQITISSTKRNTLMEITIYLEGGDSALADANAWANTFLGTTASGCAEQSSAMLSSEWGSLKASYNALSAEAKAYILNGLPNAGGDAIEQALARYNFIINKYGLEHYISNPNLSFLTNEINQYRSVSLIVLLCFAALALTTTVVLLKRNKKNN